MAVQISPNIHHERVRINLNGDVIDPRTKEVLSPIVETYVPDPSDVAKLTNKQPEPIIDPPLRSLKDIKAEIERVEVQLTKLQELKKQKVDEMKKELEEAA